MPTISECYGIVIGLYCNDHATPHLHARYNGREAVTGAMYDAIKRSGEWVLR